ncbi:MAG: acetyl-CoA C-acetyltransferase [Bdellovibrionaceae bacterium]|nr:acetyl-CoA C-acetyltransferase [Pseudobdellovibrionaceae bacterium]
MNKSVYIVGGIRTPFVKSFTHYKNKTTSELMTHSLQALVKKFALEGKTTGDVALGVLMNSASNWNLARESVLSSGLSPETPAYNVQRACGSSLETALQIHSKIAMGYITTGIAGGVDTNSDAPIEISHKLRNKLLNIKSAKNALSKVKALFNLELSDFRIITPAVREPRTGLSMGEHCELMVKEWKISQEEQDLLALASHQRAALAYEDGFYENLICHVDGLKKDTFVRGDTSLEKLAKLKPVFDPIKGTITAGNASPLTDGSSCVLLASEEGLKENNWEPLAKFVDFQVSGVDFVGGAGLLMAPTKAVAELLKRNHLKLQDFDYYEIHEAFTGQVLCTLKAWQSEKYCREVLNLPTALGEIDKSRLNMKGGSVAIGHPFAATGGRIVTSLAHMISEKKGRGLISICTAGGMGITAIIEGV